MEEILNSGFLDFTSYGTIAPGNTIATAYDVTASHAASASATVTVALVLNRANDPSTLLSADWATRQQALAALEENGTLWTTYGASASAYNQVQNYLQAEGYTIVGDADGSNGYVSSAASRTIWVTLNAAQFASLFGTPLMFAESNSYDDFHFWEGNLSLPDAIASEIAAVWPDSGQSPAVGDLYTQGVTLPADAQSPGNASDSDTNLFPQAIGDLYNFPLQGSAYATGTIALNEIGIGSALNTKVTNLSFQQLLDAYRATAGIGTPGTYYVQGEANQFFDANAGGERSLDVGVVTSLVPNSTIGLYVGSGDTVFTAYQQAIWDIANNPAVLSSSWSDGVHMNPASPFYAAYYELYVDAVLRNMSVFNDAFDGGSGNETSNGIANLFTGSMSPYAMVVGGTSFSTNGSAASDETLADTVSLATAGDLGTIWGLVRGGLRQWGATATEQTTLIETVWNQYFVAVNENGQTEIFDGYLDNYATSGGVDTTQATPDYQTDFGLTPTSVTPGGGAGRGAPDVSAIAGGNMRYLTPDPTMMGAEPNGGTSAATPLWASLATQINVIFEDQGLPNLGYGNDLYYTAAAIAPASFNDITLGNNTSSNILGGSYLSNGVFITPTGLGYAAGEGYDLTTGLGSPNGVLLARALTTIAHSQMYFDVAPVLVEAGADTDTWTAGATQSLLLQSSLASSESWSLSAGSASYTFAGSTGDSYAWTAALAQQSLQADFSAELVTMFDGSSQGGIAQQTVAAGSSLAIAVGGGAASSYQAALTSDYGFVDFVAPDGSDVEVARAVAFATTAGGADDQNVVVRLRQNGVDETSVTFYKVDDYAGTINGLSPGDAGYAQAAAARAYVTEDGLTSVSAGGYGACAQTEITGVDAGDHIAMKLVSNGNTFWAFASANETVSGQDVAHLWSYGLNTWGWEDLYGGGDTDYNDLIVQLDFTSASGSGLLV